MQRRAGSQRLMQQAAKLRAALASQQARLSFQSHPSDGSAKHFLAFGLAFTLGDVHKALSALLFFQTSQGYSVS